MLIRSPTLRFLFACSLSTVLSLASLSCASPPAGESPLEVSMRWGVTEAATLPAEVTDIELLTCVEGQEDCSSNTCSVMGLTTGGVPSCRPNEAEMSMLGTRPVLVKSDLPEDTRIRFQILGKVEGGAVAYVGQFGPVVLGRGERRFASVQMYPVGQTLPLAGTDVSRFLHSATYLPDGRVLVAGGFTDARRLATCPAERMLPEDARCWELTATDEAVAFDVGSGTVTPIRERMLAPRAGHTATRLPDGRVLLTGGASRALLVMTPQGEMATGGFRIDMSPLTGEGLEVGAHASFELFDAYLAPEGEDVDRDGDPGRGRFLGTGGTMAPGALNHPRFLHAAAAVPSTPGRVLLVGGMGGARSAESYEVFDADKPGGFGVRRGPGNRLQTPRPAPSAAGTGGQVWIFGGGVAGSNEDLAEVWTAADDDPNGSTNPASTLGEFPASAVGSEEPRPEYGLVRPSVAAVGEGAGVLVVGWYGPLCEEGSRSPIFPEGEMIQVCDSPSGATRSFTVTVGTGLTSRTEVRLHAFGALAELTDFGQTPGSRHVAITGGIANASWGANAAIDVFADELNAAGTADPVTGLGVSLSSQRIFHTSTGVPGYGMVTIGGMSFDVGVENVRIEPEVEVVHVGL